MGTKAAKDGSTLIRRTATSDQTKATKDRNSKKFFSFKLYANRHSYRISPYWVQNKRTEHDIALNREGYSSYDACWLNQVVHSELAPDNTGSVGSGSGPGISTPSLTDTSSVKTSSRNPPGSRSDSSDHDRGRRADSQRGNKPSSSGPRRFCLSTFPGPQEGWRFSPGNKPESSEHVHPGGAFQDGELSYDKGTGETPGMASKGGPQGCVLSGPSSPRPPQIPPVPVARPDIPVLLPAIRPVLCSESVHKADETSGGIPEGERNEINNLFGRHTGDQQLPGGSKGTCPFNQGSIQFPGPNHQRKEITTGALTGGSIFGVSHFNSDYEHLSAVRKDEENSARSNAFVEGSVSVNLADCCFYWDDQCGETSHSNGSHVPLPTPSSDKQSDTPSGFRTSGDETELPQSSRTHCGGQRGVDLVVSSSQEPQCSPDHNPPSGFSDQDRCFPCGMGGKMPGPKDRRSLVSEGTGTAHQCFGANSSAPSNSDLHKGEEASAHSGKNRQYYSQVLHQSYQGNSLSNSQCNSLEHMELVPRASPSFVSRVPSGSGEPDSGCRVQTLGRPLRLDASSTGVRADKQLNGSTGCGSLCVQANAPITKVFQLEARPGSGSHGCIHTELESNSWLCKSPVVSDSDNTDQNSSGGSKNCAGGPCVENPALVSSAARHVDRCSLPAPTQRGPSNITIRKGVHYASGGPTVSRMAIVWEKCRSGGLSAEASQLVSASLRSKSTSSYESLFRKWNSWCMERSRDPTKDPIADVVNFLAELFHQGYQYRSLNAYRSAISSVHEKVDGEPVGQHPLVSQVLKGAFNERPPRPRYHST